MKIEKEYTDDHQIKINAVIEADPWEKAKYQAAKRLAKRVKIPGFRPGKAPYNVILRTVGEAAVTEEALELLIDEIYPQILDEAEIEPYGPGSLDEVTSFDPPTFDFVVPLKPEVELGDYKSLEIAYELPEANEEEFEQMLENLRKQHAQYETVDRPAEDGDAVYLRVNARILGVEDPEEAELYDQQFSSARLGEENSATDRQFFDGFSAHLIGMAKDEEKSFTHTYPEDSEDEELQGAEVEYTVFITNVQSYSLPELDDEFAKTATEFETIEEVYADLRNYMAEQAQESYNDEYENQVIDRLIESSTIKFPPQAVEDEKKNIISNLEYRLSQQGLTLDIYKQFRGGDEGIFDQEIAETAEKNVRRELVLFKLIETEDIQADQEKLSDTTGRAIDSVTAQMTPKEIKELQQDGRLFNMVNSIAMDMTFRKAVEYLSAIAKGEPLPEASEADETEAGEEAAPESESTPEEAAPTPTSEDDTPTEGVESTPEEDESEDA